MARVFGNSTRSESPAADRKPADGYINIFVSTENGDVKLGFVALSKESDVERQLIDWLEKDPANAGKLGSALQFRYNSGAPKARGRLVLPE